MVWEGLWVMAWEGLWVMDQGLAELVAEGLPPVEQGLAEFVAEGLHLVEQSVPLNVPQIFCTEMLKFLPAMPQAHPRCTVLVSITYLNNGYLNNNKKALLCIYKLTFKKAMASDITARISGFGASACQNAGY